MAMARRVKRINPGVEWMSAFMRAMLAMDRWTERSDRWKVQSYMQTAIKQRHIRDLVCQDANSRDGFASLCDKHCSPKAMRMLHKHSYGTIKTSGLMQASLTCFHNDHPWIRYSNRN
jgi:hypothetical protein